MHDAPRHPEPGSDEAKKALYPVTVRFTDPHGRSRTAKTDVVPAPAAGSTTRVWGDADGKITDPPLTTRQVRDGAIGCAVLAAMAVPLLDTAAYAYAYAYAYARRRLERHNLAQWDSAWARVAPRWTASH
ncbi:hypothetical protein [Streptomyces canus]|uniref:Rv1733c family protein n=1 Tax=Streptomyces canus TaxID=58343 RepID=UPI0036F09036